ncbi:hypothetical protein [Vibrio mediterranei]|uniref:hypothetical protein n=1 Tax=Vibrio mediterranei TaxID=689 RepID=UPI004069900D
MIGNFQEREIEEGTVCRVYRNLNKPGHFSVIPVTGNFKGKVVAHVRELFLIPAESKPVEVVMAGGQARAKRERVRNVHLYLQGAVYTEFTSPELDFELTYQPFQHDGFVSRATEERITDWTKAIYLTEGKAWMMR